jgi:hypothetical protein
MVDTQPPSHDVGHRADFLVHSRSTAPTRGARSLLRRLRKTYGRISPPAARLAGSEQALGGRMDLVAQFDACSSRAAEKTVIRHCVSVRSHAGCCVATYADVAHAQAVPADLVDVLRRGQSLADPRLESLRRFTIEALEKTGRVDDHTWPSFLSAGYIRAQALEVVGGALKTMSNLTSRTTKAPTGALPAPFEWAVPNPSAAATHSVPHCRTKESIS